jgi:hypothetical protein
VLVALLQPIERKQKSAAQRAASYFVAGAGPVPSLPLPAAAGVGADTRSADPRLLRAGSSTFARTTASVAACARAPS